MNLKPTSHSLRLLAAGLLLLGLVTAILVQHAEIVKLRTRSASTTGETISRNSLSNPGGATPETNEPPATRTNRTADTPASEGRVRELQTQLNEISRPLVEDMASSEFRAELQEGQTIVTGGFPTMDGKNQFTMLVPRRVTLPDGTEAIEIDTSVMALTPENTQSTGLDTLATSARNTLQHAETWEGKDVEETFQKLNGSPDANLSAMPKVTVRPGQSFALDMSPPNGALFTVSGTADFSGTGFLLRARVEQRGETPPP